MIAIATQCFGPDLGGIETSMTALADALAAAGERVAVFADRPRSREAFARPYEIRRFGQVRPLRGWMKRRAIAQAADLAPITGVFADSWKSMAAIPPGPAPIAVFAHGAELPPDASPRRARRVASAFSRAQAVIANSAYTAGLARNFLSAASPPVLVVPPPIIAPAEPTAEALAEIDGLIAGRGPVLVTVARLEPRKGIDAVLRALPAVRREFPQAVYFVAGAGPDLGRLQALAASLRIEEATRFLGRIDEARKSALLTRADLFAMPARREGNSVEGYGLAYVEAAWRGKPSLAGRTGGAADAVIDDETGLLCNGEDDAEVTAALIRLLGDEPLRDRLGAAAQSRAQKELIWPVALPQYLAALRR
ncbi:MAG TPA: glycosyltransferase family 4 protein [Roseiarcus sp.]|nr:glycosyltransferase family 4 protein [Roseiarcus sp.]